MMSLAVNVHVSGRALVEVAAMAGAMAAVATPGVKAAVVAGITEA
jgi:hypothetical protein